MLPPKHLRLQIYKKAGTLTDLHSHPLPAGFENCLKRASFADLNIRLTFMFLLGSTAPFLPYLLLMLTTLAAWWGDWSAGSTESGDSAQEQRVEAVAGAPEFEAGYFLQNIPAKKEIRTQSGPAADVVPSRLQKLFSAARTLLRMEAPERSCSCHYAQSKQWRGPPAKE
jgi:hypothetical protein